MRVAISGAPAERAEAALLWGLFACEAGSAAAATQAFAVAAPADGLGRLAFRRLLETLQRSSAGPALWQRAAAGGWLTAEERAELMIGAAESVAGTAPAAVVVGLLPAGAGLPDGLRLRVLAVRARIDGARRAEALREVAREAPHRFADLFPDSDEATVVAGLTGSERRVRAAAWLAAGRSAAALREASALGDDGAEVAARAALELRRPQAAVRWARRLGGTPAGLLLLAEAQRQQAWSATPAARGRAFREVAATAARLLAGPASDADASRARVLRAEALTELGVYREAAELLAGLGPDRSPRWEWVWRRLLWLQGRRGRLPAGIDLEATATSGRGRRLATYWRAATASGPDRAERLEGLADSGFPDLPALWAAQRLGRAGVPVQLQPATASPAVPEWAVHLLDLGRVSDIVVAWRAALTAGQGNAAEWLSLVKLADYPTIDAVPLLLRGEPRLLGGPWSGLPRPLLEAYLPLPLKAEVEAAARAAGMPPWVLAGLVRQESAWNVRARSPAGALGLTQILPSTAPDIARWSRRRDLAGRSLFDPEVNLTLGALHTAGWFRTYRSWAVALACHNAGERRVRAAWLAAGRSDGPEFVESLEIPETWDYVHRVVLWAEGYRLLYWPEGEPYPWT